MRLSYQKELNKRLESYLENLLKNKKRLNKENISLFDAIIKGIDYDSDYNTFDEITISQLKELIQKENISDIANLADGQLGEVLRYMLGDEYTALFRTYLKLCSRCPHTIGYSRRSQRSVNPLNHLDRLKSSLRLYLKIHGSGFSDLEILTGKNTSEEKNEYNEEFESAEWMAAQIVQGNQTVISYLINVLTSENNANRLRHNHLRAISMSGHRPLLELEGKLLLAAKLQEGLRQAIVETMDEGSPESYLHLFSVIYNNDLQRFASVKRSFAVCTGIGEQDSSERITKKYVELMHTFLNDVKLARKALQSKDTAELYLALWSIGFYNTDDIKAFAQDMVKNGAKHQVQTLLWFLKCTQNISMYEPIAKQALEIWHHDPTVVAGIIPIYMNNINFYRYKGMQIPVLSTYFDSEEEAIRHYGYLKQIYQSTATDKLYSPYVFPFISITLTHSEIVQRMASIAWMVESASLKDDICTYLSSLDSYIRSNYIDLVLSNPTSELQQEYILQSMGDRTEYVRNAAYRILADMQLTSEQYQKVEEVLRFKYSEMRVNAINLLMKQPKEQLSISIHRLLTDKIAERRLAGLDMMKMLHNVPSMQDTYQALISTVKEIRKPNAKEKVLMESLLGDGTEKEATINYIKENGFGLYPPEFDVTLPEIVQDKGFNIKKVFEFIHSGKAKIIFTQLNAYIGKYKDEEFKNKYGDASLIGNSVLLGWSSDEGLKELAYPELWQAFYKEEIRSFDKLLMMKFMLASTGVNEDDDEEEEEGESQSTNTFEPIVNKMYNGIAYRGLQKDLRKLKYYVQISHIITALAHDYHNDVFYQQLSVNMLLQLLPLLNSQNIFRQYTSKSQWLSDKQTWGEKEMVYPIHNNKFVNFWLDTPIQPIDNALFARYFTVRYQLYKLTNYMDHTPELAETDAYLRSMDFARAWMWGLIPKEEVYRELMGRTDSPNRIEGITTFLFGGYRYSSELNEFSDLKDLNFSIFLPLAQNVISRILDIELKRGDMETQVTRLAIQLRRIYGAEVFIRILKAFGKDTIIRDNYNWRETKRGVLSQLLRNCYPDAEYTSDLLKKLAQEAEISEERLVEAAMFSPQWLELTEKAISWKGLVSAAYYFRAHTSESCDDKEKAIIARYSPIDVEDLQGGAFDIEWFKDAYKTIGKQRFEVVYNAAKYVSSNNGHTRARKFADAVNGKLIAQDVQKEIIDKRNKDLLMSYGLIPLGRKADNELLERYQYIQAFLKESKGFGAQRQESEKKAVNIALQNLARNSGYGDITRLMWSMETKLIKGILPYFKPKEIEGVEVFVQVNEEGKSELKQVKAGKELNSLPAKLKKHPYIEELKTVHKQLKDQYTRSRIMLEQAMEDCTRFEENELSKLMKNPVVWPLLKNLVFTSEGRTGFYNDGQLISPDGVCLPLDPKTELRIAHPTDLYASGQWAAHQKLLFDKAICQPFKQVFRELYISTPEEADATQSRRYAGNQIQPQKTVAVLKGRRWVADYEDGLQKIYYKENIIATIYAMADWFSPADIEAPTLEYVCFYNRKDYKLMKISEIPPVIFSEVMRDVDLAVSVAHAGSVDPETSHSTIEMRSVLVELSMPLFRLKNVVVKGSFAHIEGKLGTYNIHLGSGVIHQEGGAQIAVLPVHSQSRGRLFLPFVDEDPKTAEILTKIIIFAEDEKIKDPSILNQIK